MVPPVDHTPAATKAAQVVFAEYKAQLLEKCWKLAIAKNPKPASAKWTVDVTFSSEGVEIARGISDVRGAERPDVAQCLRSQPIGLKIPPPPKNTRVTIELNFP